MAVRNKVMADLAGVLRWGYPVAHNEIPEPAIPDRFVSTHQNKTLAQRPAMTEKPPVPVMPAKLPDTSPGITVEGRNDSVLDQLHKEIRVCTRCSLCTIRRHAVAGTGSPRAKVMILGSAPGMDEDQTGMPFLGAAGQYLDKWLGSVNLDRYTSSYLSYVLHCRLQNESEPDLSVMSMLENCRQHLDRQIDLVKPQVMLLIGKKASEYLFYNKVPQMPEEGFVYRNIPVLITHEPADVLRDPALKRQVWEVLKLLKAKYIL